MNINEHPVYKAIYDLCLEIEKLPASEQATKVVVMASALENPVRDLLNQKKVLVELVSGLDAMVPNRPNAITYDQGWIILDHVQDVFLPKAKQALEACK